MRIYYMVFLSTRSSDHILTLSSHHSISFYANQCGTYRKLLKVIASTYIYGTSTTVLKAGHKTFNYILYINAYDTDKLIDYNLML